MEDERRRYNYMVEMNTQTPRDISDDIELDDGPRVYAHNECPMCGKHIPDNKGACPDCIKRGQKATRKWVMQNGIDGSDPDAVANAIDAMHSAKRNSPLRYWPK